MRPFAAAALRRHPTGGSPDDAIQTGGAIDATKYAAVAASYWDQIPYRFGAPAPGSGTIAGTTYYERTQLVYPVTGAPDNNPNGRNANFGFSGTYGQGLGVWQDIAGEYSSDSAAGPYVADAPTTHVGAYNIEHSDVSNGVLGSRPELAWTRYGGGDEAVEVVTPWKVGGYPTYKPTAFERGQGRAGWGCQVLFCFQPDPSHATHPNQSFVCTTGANTMQNRMGFYLPAGLVCTALCVTNSGEFAVFACWDATNVKAVLVFAALTSLGDGCTFAAPDAYPGNQNETSWGEARFPMPGRPGIGNYMYGKVIGQIDLPSTMKAPTGISCTTSKDYHAYMPAGPANNGCWADATWPSTATTNGLGRQDLRDRADWDDGGFYSNVTASSGVAWVISRTEKKAVRIDLAPLFLYYRHMYFGGTDAEFHETEDVGDGAGQWPYTFTEAPTQVPTAGTPISLSEVPVCVHCVPCGNDNVLIGTESGKVLKYTLNGTLQATYTIGSNITGIRQMKEKSSNAIGWDKVNTVFVTSRGTRAVMAMDLTNGTVLKTIQPSADQLADPIMADDGDNAGAADYYCLSVASYTSKTIEGFMYGPFRRRWAVSPADDTAFGPGPTGTDSVEYAGSYPVLGKPWGVTGANIS